MSETPVSQVLALCVSIAVLGVVIDRRRGFPKDGVSATKIGFGVAMVAASTLGASALIGVDVQPPPEQLGIGVEVVGLSDPLPERADDRGLTLAMAVELDSCDGDVHVRLTLAPTAEFWIDNRRLLAGGARVRFAIPDPLGAGSTGVTQVKATTGADGLAPFATAVPKDPVEDDLTVTSTKQAVSTFVDVTVPAWGTTFNPLTVEFDADWTRARSLLGSCYVALPAVVGLPTVLGAAQLTGDAIPIDEEFTTGGGSLFVVSSPAAKLKTYYSSEFEVTRGVTSLELEDHNLLEEATLPAPDANLGSAPAWTCRSTTPRTYGFSSLEPGEDATDVFVVIGSDDATAAFSAERQAELLGQRTCASFVAVESAGAGVRRDLVLIIVGAVFGPGLAFIASGVRRSKPAKPPQTAGQPRSRT